nr:serine/threonine-protein kinase [Pseudenhygromyxa sp. WMMC2535]
MDTVGYAKARSTGPLLTEVVELGTRDTERIDADVAPGQELGEYRLEQRLGIGGMGEVFAALHLPSEEIYALKVLGRVSPTALYRFKREFRALADVTHPNLISLHELVVLRGTQPFFTMELIDGSEFTRYVRGRAPQRHLPNLVRLNRAVRQLLAGLQHLHLSQRLHRDVKPSNVLVTREGRVVILDFGLVSEPSNVDAGLTHDGALIGTPAYMAPEQAVAGKVGTPADYYAVGVMLYECLTGELPYKGSALQIMLQKQEGKLPDPRAKVPAIPEELGALCMQLMAWDPAQRPSGLELLARLEDIEDSVAGVAPTRTREREQSRGVMARARARETFVGRERELEVLDAALRDVAQTHAAQAVLVKGAPGMGKSSLLRRFLARARRERGALILSGRCFERESVPYKGVDAIVDALSVQLCRLSEIEREALRPRNVAALIRIFPVLGAVWPAQGAALEGRGGALTELRRLGTIALRELLGRLSARKPVVLCIDDFQWAKRDSGDLLGALMRPPNSPRVLVLLGACQGVSEGGAEPRSCGATLASLGLAESLAGVDGQMLELAPMTTQEGLALAERLMGEAVDLDLAHAFVERARGNPFHLEQLVLGAVSSDVDEDDIDQLVTRRVVGLDAESRRLLAAVAIAGGPLPVAVLVEIFAPTPQAQVEALIDELCRLGLLVRACLEEGEARGVTSASASSASSASSSSSSSSSRDAYQSSQSGLLGLAKLAVNTAHGRIRKLVVGELELVELRGLHLQLAGALSGPGADLETLAEHFALGGNTERAAEYAEQAAEAAAGALAFARAVELYRWTLELLPKGASELRRRSLQLGLAHQLIYLGHGSEAADLLLELAVGVGRDEARELRRLAAEQLLRSGRLDEGLALSRELLAALGESMPRSFWGAAWMFISQRARLWLRSFGRAPALRSEAEVPEALLTRLDMVAMVASSISMTELVTTQALHARALVLAQEAGEPRRLALMLAYACTAKAALGRSEAAKACEIQCREIAAHADELQLDLTIELSAATADWFSAKLNLARDRFAQLLARLESVPGADWVRVFSTIRYAETCILGGYLAELRREMTGWLSAARTRGNLHELASLHGLAAIASLYDNDLEGARRQLALGRELWRSDRFTLPGLTLDLAALDVHLFAGELEAGFAQVEVIAARARDNGLHRLRSVRDYIAQAEDRCVVRAALQAPARRELLDRVRASCKRHHRYRDPFFRGQAHIHEAAQHSLMNDREATRRSWRAAELEFLERGQLAMLAVVRLRLSELTSGRESAEYQASAEAYLSEQAVPGAQGLVDWLVPRHG